MTLSSRSLAETLSPCHAVAWMGCAVREIRRRHAQSRLADQVAHLGDRMLMDIGLGPDKLPIRPSASDLRWKLAVLAR